MIIRHKKAINMTKVLLIRHGQTDWNTNGRWQGALPIGLNTHGREQAQRLAQHLARRPITHIYSSDLPRALETAEILGQTLNVTPIADARLREMHLGVFQGLTREDVLAHHADEYHAFQTDYFDHVIMQGESRRQVMARALAVLEDALAKSALRGEIAVVSHGVTIRMLLTGLFPDDAEHLRHAEIGNTSLTTLEHDGTSWRILTMGSMHHLADIAAEIAADHGEAATLAQEANPETNAAHPDPSQPT